MINLKFMTMPAAVPLAGSLFAMVLSVPMLDSPASQLQPERDSISEARVERDLDEGAPDVRDYPTNPPLEWTLGTQSPDALEVSEHAQQEANGLAWQILREGDVSRSTPAPAAIAKMRFVGWTADGKPLPGARALTMIPMEVPLDEMVPGFSQAAQQMHPGERRRVWIPQELAFDGREGRPEGAIVYDMELVSWKDSGPMLWDPGW